MIDALEIPTVFLPFEIDHISSSEAPDIPVVKPTELVVAEKQEPTIR